MKKYVYELMTDRKEDAFSRLLKPVLLVFSLIYSIGVFKVLLGYRWGIFRTHKLSKPVISIGNITVGGVGKTPLVISIVEFLKREGLRPAVLLRGYMDPSLATHAIQSDEAMLLKESLPDVPILVGSDRIKNARSLSPEDADLFILDDGFQHWKLRRDLDIVAIDATNPFGNEKLLPRGILREPLTSLSRAHFFVITKSDLGQQNLENLTNRLKSLNPRAPLAYARHRPVALIDVVKNEILPLSFLEGKKICSFCSIGDPHSFLNSLSSLGASIEKNFAFMDHYVYQPKDLEHIQQFCHSNEIKVLVTTQKDAVKVRDFWTASKDIQVLTLKIALDFTKGQEALFKEIVNLCHKH